MCKTSPHKVTSNSSAKATLLVATIQHACSRVASSIGEPLSEKKGNIPLLIFPQSTRADSKITLFVLIGEIPIVLSTLHFKVVRHVVKVISWTDILLIQFGCLAIPYIPQVISRKIG